VIGSIGISCAGDRAYSYENLGLLERISAQIAPVIESLNLLEQVQSLAATVESTQDLVAIADLRGITSYINPAGLQMLGFTRTASGVGIPLTDFVSDEVVEIIRTSGLRQADDSGRWKSEISISPKGAEESIPV
jgi:PAS domain-containing protein